MRQATRERHARVLTELLDKKHVTVHTLAANMGVSEATVRRDLKTLAEQDKLHLVHGGAMLPRDSYFSFEAKADRNHDAKAVIGRLAASLVARAVGDTGFGLAARAAGRPDIVFWATAASALLTCSAGVCLVARYGAVGAAAGSLLSSTAGCAVAAGLFWKQVR